MADDDEDEDAGCSSSPGSDSWNNLNLRTQGWQCRWSWSPMMNNNGLVVELVVPFALAAAAPGRLHGVRK